MGTAQDLAAGITHKEGGEDVLESLREERFTEAVEMTESVKLINDAIAKVAEAESILTTAAALVNAPHDDRILAFVMDLENLEIDLKRQTERME